jgi:hypothetical protein
LQLAEQWPEEREDGNTVDNNKRLVKAKKALVEADVVIQLGSIHTWYIGSEFL